jgi:hypothetical protein
MSDQPRTNAPSLSEISHLFLSSVRERGGGARPVRTPPGRNPGPVTAPEPSPQQLAAPEQAEKVDPHAAAAASPVRSDRIQCVLAHHLGSKDRTAVAQYAATLGRNVGIIEARPQELLIHRLDPGDDESSAPAMRIPLSDRAGLLEALTELDWDVDRWIIALPQPRDPGSRTLLQQIGSWVLITQPEHEAVVEAYRAIKGIFESRSAHCRLTLAVLGGGSAEAVERVRRKLSGVCGQFLGWEPQHCLAVSQHHSPRLRPVVVGYPAVPSRPEAHWDALSDFVGIARETEHSGVRTDSSAVAEDVDAAPEPGPSPAPPPTTSQRPDPTLNVAPETEKDPIPALRLHAELPAVPKPAYDAAESEVIDLPGGDGAPDAVAAAVLRGMGGLLECPIRPPSCPSARLAVDREGGLVLLAVAGKGLPDLEAICEAQRWMCENRQLIGLAFPQMKLDPAAEPKLRLLVDHLDARAGSLQRMMQSGVVQIIAFRRLSWLGKSGLLLDAA